MDFDLEMEWGLAGAFLYYQIGPARWVMAGDDGSGEYVAAYTDDRPVSRIYRMTLERCQWRIWRDPPGLRQRIEGRIGDGVRRIVARWDENESGGPRVRDFDLEFVRP